MMVLICIAVSIISAIVGGVATHICTKDNVEFHERNDIAARIVTLQESINDLKLKQFLHDVLMVCVYGGGVQPYDQRFSDTVKRWTVTNPKVLSTLEYEVGTEESTTTTRDVG